MNGEKNAGRPALGIFSDFVEVGVEGRGAGSVEGGAGVRFEGLGSRGRNVRASVRHDVHGVQASPAPRPVIRGANSQHQKDAIVSSLGWLQGSFNPERFMEVSARFTALFGEPVAGPALMYREARLEFSCGVLIAFDHDLKSRPAFRVPAKGCEFLTATQQRNLIALLLLCGGNFSRLDATSDDYERSILPSTVFRIARDQNIAKFKWQLTELRVGKVGYKGRSGDTFYAGRRGSLGSGRYLRVYDKSVESKGEIDAIRWEIEFSDEPANQAARHLAACNSDASYLQRLADLVASSVDFIDRGKGDKNLSRCPRLPWWDALLSRMGKVIAFIRHRTHSTFATRREWFEKCCASFMKEFAIFHRLTFRDGAAKPQLLFQTWLNELIDAAELSKKQILEMRAYCKELNILSPV